MWCFALTVYNIFVVYTTACGQFILWIHGHLSAGNRKCIGNGIPTIVKLLQVFFAESKKLNLLWNELKPFNRDKNLYNNHFIQILLNTSPKTGQQYIVAMRNLYTRHQAYIGFTSSWFCSQCPEGSNFRNSEFNFSVFIDYYNFFMDFF